jgi:uncharacterized protein YjbJ (UPF0337 family)/anti-sigma regulatory factor (Ser/Thr protein kinase)
MLDTPLRTHTTARFDPEPRAPREARKFVTETLARWSCDRLAEAASLLTSELVTNAVLHAGTPVELTLCRMGGGVRVEVADEAPQSVERARPVRQEEATTGRGLTMVEALAEHWGVTLARSGKSVWFELEEGFDRDRPWVTRGRHTSTTREETMGSRMDEAKGRAKEAAGDLTDDRDLEREGKMDRAGATAKEKLENAKDTLENTVDKVKDKANELRNR